MLRAIPREVICRALGLGVILAFVIPAPALAVSGGIARSDTSPSGFAAVTFSAGGSQPISELAEWKIYGGFSEHDPSVLLASELPPEGGWSDPAFYDLPTINTYPYLTYTWSFDPPGVEETSFRNPGYTGGGESVTAVFSALSSFQPLMVVLLAFVVGVGLVNAAVRLFDIRREPGGIFGQGGPRGRS